MGVDDVEDDVEDVEDDVGKGQVVGLGGSDKRLYATRVGPD